MDSAFIQRVPPSPDLMAQLYARYQELLQKRLIPSTMTFVEFFQFWSSSRRSENFVGLDDGATVQRSSRTFQPINKPEKKLKGVIRTIVLLVDFMDRPATGTRTPAFYQQMLFGEPGVFPSGSMSDYYRTISNYTDHSGIDIQGEVYGWFRMPRPLAYYTNNASGGADQPPRNAQGMARDAVELALANGVHFDKSYDALGEGLITALFIVHAGRGAEETGSRDDIWSMKWVIPGGGFPVGPQLKAETFLTAPEDCNMGVCAHEWGHLAARWADFYDTGDSKFTQSNGLGDFCLMASGSWGNHGMTPTLPNGMLRMFHGWITPEIVTTSQKNLVLTPAAEGGSLILIQNIATMTPQQYVFAEYRRRNLQDAFLPDDGLALYIVDEAIDNVNDESRLAIELIQADNRRDLARLYTAGNRGDNGDLYPYKKNRKLGKTSKPALKLPAGTWPGIDITVKGNPGDQQMRIDVRIT